MSVYTMRRLIILSDLWGKEKSEWVSHYEEMLKELFEIKYYDCCVLGDIDTSTFSEENIHRQFLNGGIEKSITTLLQNETEELDVLGFSIGGYIGWKAALAGLKVNSITAVSSTRIRYEQQKPKGVIELYFGEYDNFKPDNDWFERLNLERNIFRQEDHDFYRKKEIAVDICARIRAQNRK